MTEQSPRSGANILPRDKGAASLDVVIAIMAFLAALAIGAGLLAERAAVGWRQGLADRLTVQIVPGQTPGAGNMLEKEAGSALRVLRSTPGIAHAAELSSQQTAALVEPWLGKSAIIPELPMPRMIDVSVVPGTWINLAALTQRLSQSAPHAVLDDHSRWIGRLKGLADTIIISAYGILLLIAVAMSATVAFATRAGLAAHHEKVELLHRMGANSGFIARAFERHYLLSSFFAGAAGAGFAALVFVIAGGLELAGIQTVPFLPPLALKFDELAWFVIVPVAAAAIAFGTARFSVIAALRGIY